MSWSEYQEWMVFDTMEPIGFLRDDHHAAHLALAAARPHYSGDLHPADFQPFNPARFDEPDEDEEEVTVGSWLNAARRAGLTVIEGGEA